MTSEQRQLFIDQVLAASAETLAIPEVCRRLGSYAAMLQHGLQHIATPPIEADGHFSIDGYRRNTTPLVALHIGEVTLRRPRDLQFNRIQRRHIRDQYAPDYARQLIDAHSSHYRSLTESDDMPYFKAPDVGAFVYAHQSEADDEDDEDEKGIYLRGQPVIALNLDVENKLSPDTLLHELTHVSQVNRQPVMSTPFTNIESMVSRELEAYYVSAQVIRGYHDSGRYEELIPYCSLANQSSMLTIDEIRARHRPGGRLPFRPTDEMIKELVDEGLEIVVNDDLAKCWENRHDTL